MNPRGWNSLLVVATLILLGLGIAGAAGAGVNTWTSAGPPGADVLTITVDPANSSTIYLGTQNGVFKSIDGGANWRASNAGLASGFVATLVVDPSNSSVVYAAISNNASGIYKSVDAGVSWRASNAGIARLGNLFVQALSVDFRNPATLYAGAMEYGCEGPCAFKSTNGGETWSIMGDGRTPSDILDFAIDPTDAATLYAATYGLGVFKSTDGGESWSANNAGLASDLVYDLEIDPSASATLYAGTFRNGVIKTTDGGATWRSVNTGLAGVGSVYALAIDPRASGTLYTGTAFGVFATRNGGETWAPMNAGLLNRAVNSLTIDPRNPARLYAGTPAGLFVYLGVPGSCGPPSTTLCLNNGRFAVTAEWFDRESDSGGPARAVALTADTGYFTFFDAANVELVVKVLNGCGINSSYWTFAAGLTDVEMTFTLTDTVTGAARRYTNPEGVPFQPIQDTGAFDCR